MRTVTRTHVNHVEVVGWRGIDKPWAHTEHGAARTNATVPNEVEGGVEGQPNRMHNAVLGESFSWLSLLALNCPQRCRRKNTSAQTHHGDTCVLPYSPSCQPTFQPACLLVVTPADKGKPLKRPHGIRIRPLQAIVRNGAPLVPRWVGLDRGCCCCGRWVGSVRPLCPRCRWLLLVSVIRGVSHVLQASA